VALEFRIRDDEPWPEPSPIAAEMIDTKTSHPRESLGSKSQPR
jgi:hypothetical protein